MNSVLTHGDTARAVLANAPHQAGAFTFPKVAR